MMLIGIDYSPPTSATTTDPLGHSSTTNRWSLGTTHTSLPWTSPSRPWISSPDPTRGASPCWTTKRWSLHGKSCWIVRVYHHWEVVTSIIYYLLSFVMIKLLKLNHSSQYHDQPVVTIMIKLIAQQAFMTRRIHLSVHHPKRWLWDPLLPSR